MRRAGLHRGCGQAVDGRHGCLALAPEGLSASTDPGWLSTVDRRKTDQGGGLSTGRPQVGKGLGAGLGLDAGGEISHLVVQAAALADELADLAVGVHDGCVVASPERLTDLRQGQIG